MKLQAFSYNYHIPTMDKQLINLFPMDIRKGITEIFGQQPLQTVLTPTITRNHCQWAPSTRINLFVASSTQRKLLFLTVIGFRKDALNTSPAEFVQN